MNAKELRCECPACRARLVIDVRSEKVVAWQAPERSSLGRRTTDAERAADDEWSRAAKRVAERGERSTDRFEAALAKEALREKDLDDLFAPGRGARPAHAPTAADELPRAFSDEWFRFLARGECDLLTARACGASGVAGVKFCGPGRLVHTRGICELFDLEGTSDAELDELLAAARRAAAQHAGAPTARVLPLAEAGALQRRLAARGFVPDALDPVFVRELDDLPPVPGHVRVAASGDFDAWCRVASYSGGDEGRTERIATLRKQFADGRFTLFLARDGGEAVAAGALFVHDGLAVMAYACTLPEQRGRGHQRALIAARLAAAKSAGARLVVSLPEVRGPSQSATVACGFRLAFHQALWVPRADT
jgi:ribosomal protein S18 acetylase RimI-like enzyme